MAGISSTGIGSGLDIQGLVSQIMAAEAQAPSLRLTKREAKLQAELSSIGTLKGAVSEFQAALASLNQYTTFNKRSTSSSDSDAVTISASSAAAAGSYSVEVDFLAEAHKLASSAFTTAADPVGTGTLTFQFGDPSLAAQTVDITDADNSLEGIRDAVNAADIGVRASVVKGDAGYQLVFVSEKTGTDNSLKITVADDDLNDTDTSGLSQLAYDPAAAVGSGKNMTEQAAAVDAVMRIDGITVTSATNTISDAVSGVTFTLKGTTAQAETVSVSHDTGAVSSAVEGFVKAFNSLNSTISSLTSYNAETGEAGALIGDAAVRGVETQVRRILSSAVDNLSGKYQSLAEIGISTEKDGSLLLDSSKLNAAMEEDFEAIGRIFAAAGQVSDSQVSYLDSGDDTVPGEYAINITQLATQGLYTGAAASGSITVTSGVDDTLAISVDGVSSGTITLAAGVYATEADLAAELQSKINGASAFQSAGISVKVSHNGTGFEITSDRYGSASSVAITSSTASANVGLTIASGTDGVDVAGTIGGRAATGNGQTLTGDSGAVAGLAIEILGGATGDRGSVTFSRGVADQLGGVLTRIVSSDGFLTQRTDSLDRQIEDIDSQRQILNERLARLEARYLKQFNGLDSLLAQMNQTSSYLASQLANLPTPGK